MTKLYCSLLLALLLGLSATTGYAQQALPSVPVPATLHTRADTVAALHQLFQEKRETNGHYLVAAPAALALTMVGFGFSIVNSLSGNRPSAVLPAATLGVGTVGTAALLNRYFHYTKSSEADVISRYEQKGRLPGWVKRRLLEQQTRAVLSAQR